MKNNMENLIKLASCGMLAAMSVVLMVFVRFPLIPTANFLTYDMGDIPILIGAVLFGPLYGLAMLFAACFIEVFTVSDTGAIGFVMHFFASGIFILTAGLIRKKMKSKVSIITGLLAGTVLMVLFMIPWNLIITPRFLGVPAEAVKQMLVPAIIPFNLLKGIINSAVTAALFFPLMKILKNLKILDR
ncbi:MAG: ECF transporter S component [Oscillospiraceae bacterium]|nr:ECF transporter S component [Oscillospiraceae bacterium]